MKTLRAVIPASLRAVLPLFVFLFLVGCNSSGEIPTLAVLPTNPPTTPPAAQEVAPTVANAPTAAPVAAASTPGAATNPPAPATAIPATVTPRPTATSVPDITPTSIFVPDTATPTLGPTWTSNPNAFTFNTQTAALQIPQVQFAASITPLQAKLQPAVITYTFPKSKKTQQQKVPAPKNDINQIAVFLAQLNVTNIPVGDDTILYTWQFSDKNGNTLTTKQGNFKITEAIGVDPRNDLPVIDAKQTYASEFPTRSIFTVSLTPKDRIMNAKFYFTQNNGITLENFNVNVPTLAPGAPLSLTFYWNNVVGPQIPWQEFESWWVFTDQTGKTWRTEHAFNEYADKKFHTWTRTKTQYAVLYTYNRSAADVAFLSKAIDDSITRLSQAFNYKLLYAPHIVLYNNQKDYLEWSPSDMEASFSIGVASGEWGGAVIQYYLSLNFTGYSIIQHELTHLFQFQAGRSARQNLPTWWIEGTARYFEQVPTDDYEAAVRKISKAKGAPNLAGAVPAMPPGSTAQGIAWPYYVGMSAIKYLVTTYGSDVLARIHIELAKNTDFSEALKDATGKSLSEIATDYAKWITS